MEIVSLLWLPANEAKLLAHGVTRDEVEAMIVHDEWAVTTRPAYPDQVRVIGPNSHRTVNYGSDGASRESRPMAARDWLDINTSRGGVLLGGIRMRPADSASQSVGMRDEPQPWRTPEDAVGWRLAGVGKRHPRWLEFEIASIAVRYEPLQRAEQDRSEDTLLPSARRLAERLTTLDPGTASTEDVAQLTREAFVEFGHGQLAQQQPRYELMADEIATAWRAHAQRMAGIPTRSLG